MAGDDEHVQVLPLPSKKKEKEKSLHSTPRHQQVLSTLERTETWLFPTFSLSSFFISSYLCLVVVCVQRRVFTSPSSVFLVFQVFLHSFFSSQPHNLVSAGFLVMKSPMFTIVIQENNFFLKNHSFLLICTLL